MQGQGYNFSTICWIYAGLLALCTYTLGSFWHWDVLFTNFRGMFRFYCMFTYFDPPVREWFSDKKIMRWSCMILSDLTPCIVESKKYFQAFIKGKKCRLEYVCLLAPVHAYFVFSVVRPISSVAHLRLNTKPEQTGFNIPKIGLTVVFDEIAVGLTKDQVWWSSYFVWMVFICKAEAAYQTITSSSAVNQPCLDPQSTSHQELGGAAQVFCCSPQLGGWLILRP